MSKHSVQCQRCHEWWNMKHRGNYCPGCGWFAYTSDTPASPEDLQRLKEHFNAKA